MPNPLRTTRLLLGAYASFSLAFIFMPAGQVALAAWLLLAQLLTGLATVSLAIIKQLPLREVLGVSLRLPELPKGGRVLTLGLAAVGTFLFLPPIIRLVYPGFGGFAPDTLNAYTLGAAQFFLAGTMAYAGWRLLFPGLYAYASETMEGKLLESITSDLLKLLPNRVNAGHAGLAAFFGKPLEALQVAIQDAANGQFERLKEFGFIIQKDSTLVTLHGPINLGSRTVPNETSAITQAISSLIALQGLNDSAPNISLAEVAENRKIATLTFTVRCVRFAFSISPFVFFFLQANAALASALTAVPAAAPGL